MRPKVVIAILLLAGGLLGVIALISSAGRPSSPSPAVAGENPLPAAAVSNAPVETTPPTNPPPALVVSAAPAAGTNAAAAQDELVQQKIEQLEAWSRNSDVPSRDAILSELRNSPDRQIRAAALEAAIQFNDRSVVPSLKEIAEQTQNPDEKDAILEAIEYINLPSLTEYRAAHPPKDQPASPPKPASAPFHLIPGKSQ
jgi:hypothetical protein